MTAQGQNLCDLVAHRHVVIAMIWVGWQFSDPGLQMCTRVLPGGLVYIMQLGSLIGS